MKQHSLLHVFSYDSCLESEHYSEIAFADPEISARKDIVELIMSTLPISR